MCLSVPTTDIWPNWILTYFIKISKKFQNKTWVPTGVFGICSNLSVPTTLCECVTVTGVSLMNVAIWPFQIFYCLLIEKLTDWCVLLCQLLTHGLIEFWHILLKFQRNFKTQHWSPQESMHMFELICTYNSMWVCHCDLCVSEKVAIWPFQIFYCLLIEKINGLVCLIVPTTDTWPNWILTYFIKISKNFKTQHGSPQESLHMIELICPYNSMWVCHCDWCVSEKVAIWPFQIF